MSESSTRQPKSTLLRPGWLRILRHGYVRIRRRAGAFWAYLPPFKRHLLINLVVGFGIELVFLQIHHHPVVKNLEDGAFDWMVPLRGALP